MLAKDMMQRKVVTIRESASLVQAGRLMVEHGINCLPVLDEDERLVGMVGIRDVLRVPAPSRSTAPMLKWTRLEQKLEAFSETRIGQVMARKVVSVGEEATLMELSALMANRGVHPIPVLADGWLVGVVGRADVVRALLMLSDEEGETAEQVAIAAGEG